MFYRNCTTSSMDSYKTLGESNENKILTILYNKNLDSVFCLNEYRLV